MTFQITLYDGEWERTVAEKSVANQLRQWFPRTRKDKKKGVEPNRVEFNTPEDGVLISALFTLNKEAVYFDDEELRVDKIYRCFCAMGPEYESMIEVTVSEK